MIVPDLSCNKKKHEIQFHLQNKVELHSTKKFSNKEFLSILFPSHKVRNIDIVLYGKLWRVSIMKYEIIFLMKCKWIETYSIRSFKMGYCSRFEGSGNVWSRTNPRELFDSFCDQDELSTSDFPNDRLSSYHFSSSKL